MKGSIELFPQLLEVSDEGQRRSCLVKEVSASGEIISTELWFDYPPDVPMPKDSNCDSYLLGILLLGMKLGSDIIVHGSVSRLLLANLTELQLIWNKWCPEIYSLVEIKVDIIRESDIQVAGAVVAFSGGVDAQFSTYIHATERAGYCTQKLRAGVLVHGWDIPITDIKGFSGATNKATKALTSLGLDLLVVKTNVSRVGIVNWEHRCGMAVAAVLNGLSSYAGTGLIGSGEPYDALPIPWGSHPMTDPFFSSGNFRIINDGAGFSRSEKIRILSKWSVGIKNLRFCWAGDINDTNCGSCEKCVRTRLNFLLADNLNPSCFDTPFEASIFRSIVLGNEAARTEWKLIRSEMEHTRKGIEYLPHVEKVLQRQPSSIFNYILKKGSKSRIIVKKIIEKF